MTIPESVREALFNLKSIEDVEVTRDAVLVHKWRETVCEWAVENLLNSDDDEPCSNRAFVLMASVLADSLHEFTDHYIAMVNGVRVYFYKGCEVRSPAMQATDHGGLIPRPTESQVRKLLEALKGE